MASFLYLDQNISYWTIPAALALTMLPRVYSGLTGPGKKYFDGTNPRTFAANLEKAEMDKSLRLRLQRAEACGANAMETLPLYAAAVTAGNSAGLPADTMNLLSIGYIASRVLYTWVYIWGQENRELAKFRPLVWGTGIGLIMTMFVKAGFST